MAEVKKTARASLRLNPADAAFVRRAAEVKGQSVTEFVTQSAIARAHEVLADQSGADLELETWDEFVDLLERSQLPNEALKRLLARPSRIVCRTELLTARHPRETHRGVGAHRRRSSRHRANFAYPKHDE